MIDSTGRVARGIAASSAILLISASAGFGAVYAWTQGIQHGGLLAGFTVAMALGLELAKPAALSWSLTAFGRWRLIEGTALAMLAAVAVVYSLSAELSLVATLRGDAVAKRAAQAQSASGAAERYERLRGELAALPGARPLAELDATIDAALLEAGAGDCSEINGRVSRRVCPAVAELRRERAVAAERSRLAVELRQAEGDRRTTTAVMADPGAAALASYLGLFGVKVDAALLSELTVLIAVIGLEFGSALSGILIRAAWRDAEAVSGQVSSAAPVATAVPSIPADGDNPGGPSGGVRAACPAEAGEGARSGNVVGIRKWIEANGGAATTSVRRLAAELNRPRASVYDELRRLADAGVIEMQSSRAGVRLAVA